MMDLHNEIERRIEKAWPDVNRELSSEGDPNGRASTGDFVSWQPRVSPGFPATWPPGARVDLDYYAYAAGLQPRSLRDGERIRAPWARLRADLLHGTLAFELLTRKPKEIGIQGVRPLSGEEREILRTARELEADFSDALKKIQRGSIEPVLAARVRDYYRLWTTLNTIAHEIRPNHRTFFDWLEL